MNQSDIDHANNLKLAIQQAIDSKSDNHLKVGAVLVKGNEIVGVSDDKSRHLNNPIAIAEMECIRQAGLRIDQHELTLYSIRYPDMLVAGTILQFSIGGLVIGLPESSNQAIDLLISKDVPVRFIAQDECIQLNGGEL